MYLAYYRKDFLARKALEFSFIEFLIYFIPDGIKVIFIWLTFLTTYVINQSKNRIFFFFV